MSQLLEEIIQEAKKYVQKGRVMPISMAGYEAYLSSGNRLIFEEEYFQRRRELVVLALAFEYTRDESYLPLLKDTIWSVCNEYSWALPAHLTIENNQYKEDAPKIIDLFAAETGQTLANIYAKSHQYFPTLLNERILHEINQRITQPFVQKHWSWEEKENNWSAVIAGSLGMTFLDVIESDEKCQQLITRLNRAFHSYFASFGEDGCCEEGVEYWAYGFGYYIYFAAAYAERFRDTSYLQREKVQAIAEFPYYAQLNTKLFVPFSDYNPSELPNGLLAYLQKEWGYRVPKIEKMNAIGFDSCYRYAHLAHDLLWEMPDEQALTSKIHLFGNKQWLVQVDQVNHYVFSAKGGRNDESHNHIDLGHFVLGTTAQLFLDDLGSGEYTRDYFSEKRYQYFTPSAKGHSIPIINGYEQLSGAVSSVLHFQQEQQGVTVSMDLESCYPSKTQLKKFHRQLRSDSSKQTLLLVDEFTFEKAENEIVENFITRLCPKVSGEEVILNANQQVLTMKFPSAAIEVIPVTYSDHKGNSVRAYRICWRAKLSNQAHIQIEMKQK